MSLGGTLIHPFGAELHKPHDSGPNWLVLRQAGFIETCRPSQVRDNGNAQRLPRTAQIQDGLTHLPSGHQLPYGIRVYSTTAFLWLFLNLWALHSRKGLACAYPVDVRPREV